MAAVVVVLLMLLACVPATLYITGPVLSVCGKVVGERLRKSSKQQKEAIVIRSKHERKAAPARIASQRSLDEEWEKVDHAGNNAEFEIKADSNKTKDWDGVVGFLHPFCNAGGGGERVLWAAIRATQSKWPRACCVVYTGDHDVSKEQILSRVKDRFNIHLEPSSITFLYLTTRHYVLASTWPRFTLIGQSLGSLVIAWNAFNMLVPDIFIDTMGYAFTLALSKFLFPDVPTAAYVHYPTISTDMLDSLDTIEVVGRGVNAGAGKGWKGQLKKQYWHVFAWIYGQVGGSVDVVMTNSSWTQHHITQLWNTAREKRNKKFPVEVVYPPVAVKELQQAIRVSTETEKDRQPTLLYIAQFRPEKDHQLILQAFAELLHGSSNPTASSTSAGVNRLPNPGLQLVGSVRSSADETYIYSLRLLAHELHITDSVHFVINASWPAILEHLRTASIGVNAMWNEHFGIGVVEYQAAGLISVVNDSGGPKADIVVDLLDGPTGYRATTDLDFAGAFRKALSLNEHEKVEMRLRAQKNAARFDDAVFDEKWLEQMDRLVRLSASRNILHS